MLKFNVFFLGENLDHDPFNADDGKEQIILFGECEDDIVSSPSLLPSRKISPFPSLRPSVKSQTPSSSSSFSPSSPKDKNYKKKAKESKNKKIQKRNRKMKGNKQKKEEQKRLKSKSPSTSRPRRT